MATIGQIKRLVQVNVPFAMLAGQYLETFTSLGLNPEIGLDATTLDRVSVNEYEQVKDKLSAAGLKVTLHGPFIDMSPGSPDNEIWAVTRKRFGKVVEVASIFGPKSVVLHAGYDQKRYGFVYERWFERSLDMWRWMGQALREQGVLLCLENVYEEYPEYLLSLFEQLEEEGVKFCFDTGHHALFGKVPLSEWLEVLGRYIGQLHLHDNSGEIDEHRAIGSGTVEFGLLFEWLGEHFTDPPIITLEPHKEEDLMPSLQWLEKHWPW